MTKATPLQLAKLAQDLRALADDLEKGKLRIGNSLIEVGAPVFLKTKSEFKGDSAYFALSVKMMVAGPSPSPMDRPTASPSSVPAGKTEKPRGQGSSEGKRVKKEISRLWKSLCRQIEAAEPISAGDGSTMTRLCEEFNLFGEPEWREEWDACCGAVGKCLAAASDGRWQEAKSLASEVNRRTRECHRQYK
ncbi:MAG: hypothetical protein OEV91_02050 [Desulfobulbaceae bacterium]|nr:hypothetical protein [Desulfobulbaceae bacterium]